MKKAAFIIYENFEELEAVAPIDIMRRANIEVTLLTLSKEILTKGRNSISVLADANFDKYLSDTFDCVAVSGGPGFKEAIKNQDLLYFLKRHFDSNKIVAGICAAPFILKTAGVLEGKACTAHTSVFELMGELAVLKGTVKDANVITSRGAGTAVEFGLALVEALVSKEASQNVATSICYEG